MNPNGNIPGKGSYVAKPIDTDLFIHSILFSAPTQKVLTSVTGNQLTLVYNENVNLYLPKLGYELSWAVHLTEGFATTAFSGFEFTTVNSEGDITTDWVDDNMSNITAKTVSDTVIAKIPLVRINVKRAFTFTHEYADNQSALAAESAVLQRNNDQINFSSYVFFTETYPVTSTNTQISYLKAD